MTAPTDRAALAEELSANAHEVYARGDVTGNRLRRPTQPAPLRQDEQIIAEFPASYAAHRANQNLRVSYYRQRNGVRVYDVRFFEIDVDGRAWPLKGFGLSVRADVLPHLAEAIARALRIELSDRPPASNAERTATESTAPDAPITTGG